MDDAPFCGYCGSPRHPGRTCGPARPVGSPPTAPTAPGAPTAPTPPAKTATATRVASPARTGGSERTDSDSVDCSLCHTTHVRGRCPRVAGFAGARQPVPWGQQYGRRPLRPAIPGGGGAPCRSCDEPHPGYNCAGAFLGLPGQEAAYAAGLLPAEQVYDRNAAWRQGLRPAPALAPTGVVVDAQGRQSVVYMPVGVGAGVGPGARSKSTAVLLAVFLGFWTWTYTYQLDSRRFWWAMSLVVAPFVVAMLAAVAGAAGPAVFFVVVWLLAGGGVHLWSIVDTVAKPDGWYARYPRG